MASASTQLAMRRRLAASLLIAAALHIGVLARLDWPPLPDGDPARAIQVTLTGYQTSERDETTSQLATPADAAPPPTLPAAEPTDVAATETTPADANPFAGRSVAELARAVAASDALSTAPFDTESRTLRLTNGASAGADFAYYLRSWRRKVERIGQLNYPRQAQRQGIVGSLRLLVVLSADGALQSARVLESSGHRVLDEAALGIVRLAAPYAPFSPSMREAADVLEIERTWQFRDSRLSS